MKKKYTPSLHWDIPEKNKTGLRIWNFQGYQRNRANVEFPGVTKKKLCGISRVLGIGISKGCNTVFFFFQE